MTAIYIPDLDSLLENAESFHNSVDSVTANNETDVVKITVPANKKFICLGGSASGMTDTVFRYYIDNQLIEVLRIAWTKRNVTFTTRKKVASSKEIKITAEHESSDPHDFEATIIGNYI